MNSTIQPNYGARPYGAPQKARGAKQAGTQAAGFLDMAAQAGRSRADTFTASPGGLGGPASAGSMMDLAVRSGGQAQAGGAAAVEAPSLEAMLEAKYPNIHYHVLTPAAAIGAPGTTTPTICCTRTGTRQRKLWRIGNPPGPIPSTAP